MSDKFYPCGEEFDHLRKKMKLRLSSFLLLTTLTLICGSNVLSQSTSNDGKRMSSFDGLYAVTVPASVRSGGGGPLEKEFTEGLGSSYSAYWNGDGIYLQAGHVNFNEDETIPSPSERKELLSIALANLKRYRAQNKDLSLEFELERQSRVNGIDVSELVFRGPGGKLIYRLFSTEIGIVRFTAAFSTVEAEKASMAFLDSIESPTRDQIIAEKIKSATPETLPQCPPAFPMMTDLKEKGLNGKVESISIERQESTGERFVREQTAFDKNGRISKTITFEFDGRPDSVRVYGCIDDKRVSRSGYATYENRFFGMPPLRPGAKPRDPRFTNSYEIMTKSNGDIEKTILYGNDSTVYSSSEYVYGNGVLEITTTDSDGDVTWKGTDTFDANGRIAKQVSHRFGQNGVEWRNTYTFVSFDKEGNWTKRTGRYEYFKNEKIEDTSEYTEYRSIKYY